MTTTDRELLERAAKAAGIELKGWTSISGHDEAVIGFDAYSVETWNPLTDDGDAFRLAVTRRFTVAIRPHEVEVFCEASGECLASVHTNGVSHEEATRRAIVIAAAMAGEGE